MNPGLFLVSILFAPIAAVLAWYIKPRERLVMLMLGIGCAVLRCLDALFETTKGRSFAQYFLDPPNWQSLAIVSAIFGILATILVKSFSDKNKTD